MARSLLDRLCACVAVGDVPVLPKTMRPERIGKAIDAH